MLVLGSKARDNSLDKSLLERLLLHYQSMEDVASNHHVTLVTNYQSHPDILELSGNLFYKTPLMLPQDKSPPKLHPDYPTAFLFVCSSCGEEMQETNMITDEEEAIVILEKLKELCESWPRKEWGDMDLYNNGCIMSPSRSQVHVNVCVVIMIMTYRFLSASPYNYDHCMIIMNIVYMLFGGARVGGVTEKDAYCIKST